MYLCGKEKDYERKDRKEKNSGKAICWKTNFHCLQYGISFVNILCIAPYLNILAKSFNSAKDTMLGGVTFFPRVFTWDNYDIVLKDPNIGQSALISVLRVVSGSLFSLFLQYSVAYVLLR